MNLFQGTLLLSAALVAPSSAFAEDLTINGISLGDPVVKVGDAIAEDFKRYVDQEVNYDFGLEGRENQSVFSNVSFGIPSRHLSDIYRRVGYSLEINREGNVVGWEKAVQYDTRGQVPLERLPSFQRTVNALTDRFGEISCSYENDNIFTKVWLYDEGSVLTGFDDSLCGVSTDLIDSVISQNPLQAPSIVYNKGLDLNFDRALVLRISKVEGTDKVGGMQTTVRDFFSSLDALVGEYNAIVEDVLDRYQERVDSINNNAATI